MNKNMINNKKLNTEGKVSRIIAVMFVAVFAITALIGVNTSSKAGAFDNVTGNTYTISFNTNGGSEVSDIAMTPTSAPINMNNIVSSVKKDGYKVSRWTLTKLIIDANDTWNAYWLIGSSDMTSYNSDSGVEDFSNVSELSYYNFDNWFQIELKRHYKSKYDYFINIYWEKDELSSQTTESNVNITTESNANSQNNDSTTNDNTTNITVVSDSGGLKNYSINENQLAWAEALVEADKMNGKEITYLPTGKDHIYVEYKYVRYHKKGSDDYEYFNNSFSNNFVLSKGSNAPKDVSTKVKGAKLKEIWVSPDLCHPRYGKGVTTLLTGTKIYKISADELGYSLDVTKLTYEDLYAKMAELDEDFALFQNYPEYTPMVSITLAYEPESEKIEVPRYLPLSKLHERSGEGFFVYNSGILCYSPPQDGITPEKKWEKHMRYIKDGIYGVTVDGWQVRWGYKKNIAKDSKKKQVYVDADSAGIFTSVKKTKQYDSMGEINSGSSTTGLPHWKKTYYVQFRPYNEELKAWGDWSPVYAVKKKKKNAKGNDIRRYAWKKTSLTY